MDNDTLIDQARHLFAVLEVKQNTLAIDNNTKFERLDHLVMCAYCRYLRRLNRCVLCYQHRLNDCNRKFLGNERQFCPAGNRFHTTPNDSGGTLE
jgi:hypothetical protein